MRPTDTSSGLAQCLVTELLDYDPVSGLLTWRIARAHNVKAGDVAGYVSKKDGYRHVWVGERLYSASRIIYLYMTGMWPEHTIDHINLNLADDRWANLRAATQTQQCANRGLQSRNRSGFKGVSFSRANGRWYASIKILGKSKNLGHYDTPQEASEAYASAARTAHGEFARAHSEEYVS